MNEHLKEPLSNYKNQNNPGYALLITGDWGAGKSYTILNYLSEEAIYYVSLYGLSSSIDIYASVFSAMHPNKSKLKKIVDRCKNIDISAYGFKVGIGSILSATINTTENKYIKKDKIIVFDDLERCQLNLEETLGVINKYVEHHKCRVIVICNEHKTDKKLAVTKEKLFGLTLKVIPDIDSAFESFTNHKDYKTIKTELKHLILDIFKASQIQSLRILKHTLNDCLQLYSILDQKHKSNSNFIIEFFSLFIALTYEVRSGNLTREELTNRINTLNSLIFQKRKYDINIGFTSNNKTNNSEEQPLPKIKKISDKYPSIQFQSTLISDESLINAIFNGIYDKESICQSINSSTFFMEEEKTPNWIIIYNFYNADDTILDNAIQGIDDEFKNRKITVSGEMLHLFHLRFLMSYFQESQLSYDEIEAQCIKYIDDLYAQGNIEPMEINNDPYRSSNSYNGYGFWVQDEYEGNAKRVKKHLQKIRRKAFWDREEIIHSEIIDIMDSDIKKFTQLISSYYGEVGKYSRIPVLSKIAPDKFVSVWLSKPKKEWMQVTYTLQHRYEHGMLSNDLSDEKEWLNEVIQKIEQLAIDQTGFKRYCLERLAPNDLKQLIPS